MAFEEEIEYWMKSEGEARRLALNHILSKDAMGGKLVCAPVDFSQPVKVLDSGTADGTWLLDLVSTLTRGAPCIVDQDEFVGADITPLPPPYPPPRNVSFITQDIKKPWPSSYHNRFSLVHQRLTLFGAGPSPSTALSHLYALVQPGGWIELYELTMEFPPDIVSPERTPAFCDFITLLRNAVEHAGGMFNLGVNLRAMLESLGVTDIGEEDVVVKYGRAHDDERLGKMGIESTGIVVEGTIQFVSTFPQDKQLLPAERLKTLTGDLIKELEEKGAAFQCKVVWGRKPEL